MSEPVKEEAQNLPARLFARVSFAVARDTRMAIEGDPHFDALRAQMDGDAVAVDIFADNLDTLRMRALNYISNAVSVVGVPPPNAVGYAADAAFALRALETPSDDPLGDSDAADEADRSAANGA